MKQYILRRCLLMIPTLVGITVLCFTLIQFVPGGPVEETISRIRHAGVDKAINAKSIVNEEEIENIKAYFGFDKPAHIRYFQWMGNLFKLDMGESYFYQEPVWDVIVSRFPISLFFGLVSFFFSYLICIPLGMAKALRNNSLFDAVTSFFIFGGYVIPGYALGILLIIFFSGGSYFDWFPMSGVISENHEELSSLAKTGDFLHHMFLPMTCYMASEFALLTMLMKNTVLDELKKDYMRTAIVKGASFKKAVWKHAFRNSLIPIATRMSEIFTLIFAGSILIEKVFDIDGIGLLFYNSIVSRDYNVVMGMLLLTSIMVLLGRLFSDILYVIVDPRINFN